MIEEVLERIVMALEERNVLQKRMVECAGVAGETAVRKDGIPRGPGSGC